MEEQITKYSKVIEELLSVTEPLAQYYPKNTGDFIDIAVGLYRKNAFTVSAIFHLSKFPQLGDSTMALARKIIEDFVSFEWIKMKGKDKWAGVMKRFYYTQFHMQYTFLEQLEIKPDIFRIQRKC